MAYLKDAYDKGVRNIEMESLCFAAMCHHANIKGKETIHAHVTFADSRNTTASL